MSYKILNKDGSVVQHDGKELRGSDISHLYMEKTILDPDQRIVEVVSSSSRMDLDGDVVEQKGIDHSRHAKTKSVLFGHNYGSRFLPIAVFQGHRVETRKDRHGKGYEVTVERHKFLGGYEIADSCWKAIRGGALNSVSIGFISLDHVVPTNDSQREQLGLGPGGIYFRSVLKVESSWVPVPANGDAVREAFGKGILNRSDLQYLYPKDWDRANRPKYWCVGIDFSQIHRPVAGLTSQDFDAMSRLLKQTQVALRALQQLLKEKERSYNR
jgi:hypothetical protein